MRCAGGWGVAIGALIGLWAASGAGAEEGLGSVRVRAAGLDRGGKLPAIAVRFPADAAGNATIATLIFLENPSKQPMDKLKLLSQFAPMPDQVMAAPTISFKEAGADLPTTGLSLAAGKSRPITLSVTNLAAPGTFRGTLIAEREEDWVPLATVTVERPPAPLLKILGAQNEALSVALAVNKLHDRIMVEAVGAANFEVQLVVVPLVGPDGGQVQIGVTVSGQAVAQAPRGGVVPIQVKSAGLIFIDLDAELPLAGTYQGVIALRSAGEARATARLTVTRTRPAPTVQVLGVEAVAGPTISLFSSTRLWMTLHETSGQSVTLGAPVLASLVKKADNPSKIQAGRQRVSAFAAGCSEPLKEIRLSPGETRLFAVNLPRLNAPGVYAGILQFSGADYQAIDQPITIVKKHPWWIAAGFILLGVVLSFYLRRYFKTGRPRLVQQRSVREQIDQLNALVPSLADLTDRETQVVRALQDELVAIFRRIGKGDTATADADIKRNDAKLGILGLWVACRKQVDSITPPDVATAFRDRIEQGRLLLLDPQASTEPLTKLRNDLNKMGGEIVNAVKAKLIEQVADFQGKVSQQVNVLRAEALPILQQQVEPILKKAGTLAGAANNLDDLSAARASFNAARGAYAGLLADQLEFRLNGAAPFGFDSGDWTTLGAKVRIELDEVRKAIGHDDGLAMVYYERGFASYLRTISVKLRDEANSTIAKIARPDSSDAENNEPKLSDTEKNDLKKTLADEVIEPLNGVIGKVNQNQLADASKDYDAAADAFKAVLERLPEPRKRSLVDSGDGPTTTASRLAAFSTRIASAAPAPLGPAAPPGDIETVASFDWWLTRFDLWSTAAVFFIAMLIGLQLLWASDPTWGGWDSCLKAVLWGLGFQQVAGSAFEGIGGLTDRLSK